ncbi:MrcB family domain-containing protein [Algicella marina]|uniref:DUF3578 domain-containing protein n=1 Tax=Algicella marina TaxID=2683284 RepID=A0A6P1T386_9RHOB|nr:DUF3578 domain-containing protein [Algicella marina]QHQ36221.1 DUF3578 domain-containing protein [Algicella marina]
MLGEKLSELAVRYAAERTKPFAGSDFGNWVRHDIPIEAKKFLTFLPYDFEVKSSVGAGNWASVPWLAFFDPLITTSATSGFYVVYLVNAQREQVVLSLNQGATAIYKEFGHTRGRRILERRARDICERIPDFASSFDFGRIDLSSVDDLPLGYQAGHAFGRTYNRSDLTKSQFKNDLAQMFRAYEALVDRGGTDPSDQMHASSGTADVEETRRYVLSRRIERSNDVRVRVLAERGFICEGCGINPKLDYSYFGRDINTPLEVHHSVSLRSLQEGETRRYKIPKDFLVLCPTCHRMIHKQLDLSDLEELQSKIKFQIMREIFDVD